MIDKLGLDGLGGASVRVEPTPQGTNGVTGKADAGPVVVGLEPVAVTREGFRLEWCGPKYGCNIQPSVFLYSADDIAKLQADLAAMTKKADGFFDALQLAAKINAEGQAREQQLREALKQVKHRLDCNGISGRQLPEYRQIDAALALPQDDTALNTLLAAGQVREQQLREALDICKREMQGDKWDALYIDGVLATK